MRSIELLKEEFESSSSETKQFREFYFAFKADLKRILKEHISNIEFHKGHFEVSGFFTLNDGRIYYFNVGDVRWDKEAMLIRTAEHYKDWTGGSNGYVSLNSDFSANLLKYLKIHTVEAIKERIFKPNTVERAEKPLINWATVLTIKR